MIRSLLTLTLFLILAIRCAAVEASTPRISWIEADLPPTAIFQGTLAGQGWSTAQVKALMTALPDFDHHLQQASLTRIWHEIAHRDGVCVVGAVRTPERERFALFSRRPIPLPAYRLIVRADDLARFAPYRDADGAIDLEKLAANTELKGGFTPERDYFPEINRFMGSAVRHPSMEAALSAQQLFILLNASRIDFLFGEGTEPPYFNALFATGLGFTALPIKGVARSANVYIACSNGAAGHALITQIDALLADPSQWTKHLEPLRRWMTQEDFALALSAQPQ